MKKITNIAKMVTTAVISALVLTLAIHNVSVAKAETLNKEELYTKLDTLLENFTCNQDEDADVCKIREANEIQALMDNNSTAEDKASFNTISNLSKLAYTTDEKNLKDLGFSINTPVETMQAKKNELNNELNSVSDTVKIQMQQVIEDLDKLISLNNRIQNDEYGKITDDELQLAYIYYSPKIAGQLAIKKISDNELGDPDAYLLGLEVANVYDQNGNLTIGGIAYLNSGGYVARAKVQWKSAIANAKGKTEGVCEGSRKALAQEQTVTLKELCGNADSEIPEGALVNLGASIGDGAVGSTKPADTYLVQNLDNPSEIDNIFTYKESSPYYQEYFTSGTVVSGYLAQLDTFGNLKKIQDNIVKEKKKLNDGILMTCIGAGTILLSVIMGGISVFKLYKAEVKAAGGWAKWFGISRNAQRVQAETAEVVEAFNITRTQESQTAYDLGSRAGTRFKQWEANEVPDMEVGVQGRNRDRVLRGIAQLREYPREFSEHLRTVIVYRSNITLTQDEFIEQELIPMLKSNPDFGQNAEMRALFDRMKAARNFDRNMLGQLDTIFGIRTQVKINGSSTKRLFAGLADAIQGDTGILIEDANWQNFEREFQGKMGCPFPADVKQAINRYALGQSARYRMFVAHVGNIEDIAFGVSTAAYSALENLGVLRVDLVLESYRVTTNKFEDIDKVSAFYGGFLDGAGTVPGVGAVNGPRFFSSSNIGWKGALVASGVGLIAGAVVTGIGGSKLSAAELQPSSLDPFASSINPKTVSLEGANTVTSTAGKDLPPVEHIAFSNITFTHATPQVHIKDSAGKETVCAFDNNDDLAKEMNSVAHSYSDLQNGIPDVLHTICVKNAIHNNDEVWVTADVENGTVRDKNPDGKDVKHFTYKKDSNAIAGFVTEGKTKTNNFEYLVAYTGNLQVFNQIFDQYCAGNWSEFNQDEANLLNLQVKVDEYGTNLTDTIVHSFAKTATPEMISNDIWALSYSDADLNQFVKFEKDDREYLGEITATPTKQSLYQVIWSVSNQLKTATDEQKASLLGLLEGASDALAKVIFADISSSKLAFDTTSVNDSNSSVAFSCEQDNFINGELVVPEGEENVTVLCHANREYSGAVQTFYLAAPDSNQIAIGGSDAKECVSKIGNSIPFAITFSKTAKAQDFYVCARNYAAGTQTIAINSRNTTRWTEYKLGFNLKVTSYLPFEFAPETERVAKEQAGFASNFADELSDFEDTLSGVKDADGKDAYGQVDNILDHFNDNGSITNDQKAYLATVGFPYAFSLERAANLRNIAKYRVTAQLLQEDKNLLFATGADVKKIYGIEEDSETSES